MKLLIYLIFITLMGFSSNNLSAGDNPNNGHFTLHFGDEMEKNIEVFNIQGLKVFETITDKTEIQINQAFSSGIYFVKVSSTHSTNQFKLIIHD